MNIEAVFPVPLLFDYLDIDNDKIQDRCYELKAKDVHSWQSPFLDFDDPKLGELVNIVKSKMQETAQNLYRFNSDFTISLKNYWININNTSDHVGNNLIPHMHPAPYFFSMIYYVKCDEDSGPLRLIPPHGHLEYTIPDDIILERNNFNSRQWTVNPEEKKLLGMPSWLTHYADKNKNTNDRISIAFNGAITRR